jgi:hypothetical protein
MNFSACAADGNNYRRKSGWRAMWPAGLVALAMAMSGCKSAPYHITQLQRSYRPNNIFAYPPKLPLTLQRVAVLPVMAEKSADDLPEGCAELTPVLCEQLIRTKKFEVVTVDPSGMRRVTGRAGWTGTEELSSDLLAYLRREYGCDGVLFAELTSYRAYAPLAVGWRLKLVDVRSGQIIWAADELFDASQPAVAMAAQRFTDPTFTWPLEHRHTWLALNSPSQFGRYSAAAVAKTLPDR